MCAQKESTVFAKTIPSYYNLCMKQTDSLQAKLRIWAENPCVVAMPRITNLPKFSKKSFRSYAEMNEWKRSLLFDLAKAGGAKWTPTSSK